MLACPRLLITDDDLAFRESLGEAFARRGFEVTLAEDGERGLDVARRGKFHLALVDYQMPRLSGLQMLEQLRIECPELPFILMSGAMDESLRAEAERMRAYRVMSKPLRLRQVDSLVREALAEVYGWAG
ncbi:response regulator [Candidatus Laterigemmans baculatus]|uniref:response regulator n=1 Tax=Candidatus Laterigemmans baculatus TaxID=2770505 RepID=UPI0013DD3EB9|nr:response regulator [Candidatus Laterigemmans baculatus]